MFFFDKVKSVKENDKVLEIGPGGTPHPRSDEYLDLKPDLYKSEKIALSQRGAAPELKTDKKITYYDGTIFPYKDNAFDYVIAAHVLEHVEDVPLFVSELQRVAKKGYIEYPTIVYEYLYNFDVHLNILHKKNNTIFYIKKDLIPLKYFYPVNKLLLDTLSKGYTDIVDDLNHIMFEGYEWSSKNPLKARVVKDISKLIPEEKIIQKKPSHSINQAGTSSIEIKKINNIREMSTKTIAKEVAKRPIRKVLHIARNKKSSTKPSTINVIDKKIQIYVPDDMKWTFSEGDYYEKNVVFWIDTMLKKQKKPCLFDIGANIGYYSLVSSKAGAAVVAFEPVKSTFEVLQKNVKTNKLKNIKALNVALSDKNGDEKINIYSSSGNNSLAKRYIPEGHELKLLGEQKTRILTLDNYMRGSGKNMPTLLKIDVEGFEKNVLLGGKQTILKHCPVIIVEASRNTCEDAGYDVNDILKILHKYGYKLFGLSNVAADLSLHIITGNELPGEVDNLVAVHKNDIPKYQDVLKNYHTEISELPVEYSFEHFINLPLPHQKNMNLIFDKKDKLNIFDIGMCEGEDTIRYANYYPNAMVHSFEPIPKNFNKAKKNVKKYTKNNRVRLNNLALSNTMGSFDMFVSSGTPDDIKPIEGWDYGNKSSSLLEPSEAPIITPWLKFNEKIKVKTQTIDNYCSKNKIDKIDLIHMDVQGAELMVLNGAKKMMPNIKSIWLEVEAVELYKGQPLRKDVEQFMKTNGFIKVFDTVDKVAGDQFYVNKTAMKDTLK